MFLLFLLCVCVCICVCEYRMDQLYCGEKESKDAKVKMLCFGFQPLTKKNQGTCFKPFFEMFYSYMEENFMQGPKTTKQQQPSMETEQ